MSIDTHTKHVILAMFEESGKNSIFATDCDWLDHFALQNPVLLKNEHPSFDTLLREMNICSKNQDDILVKVEIWSPFLGLRFVHFDKDHRSIVKSIASASRKENPFEFTPTCIFICWGRKNDYTKNPTGDDVVTYVQVCSISDADQLFILQLIKDH